jgi:hypothetical protein
LNPGRSLPIAGVRTYGVGVRDLCDIQRTGEPARRDILKVWLSGQRGVRRGP